MDIDEKLQTLARLESMGLVIRSAELTARADQLRTFYAGGGNRAMRRAAAKNNRRRGR